MLLKLISISVMTSWKVQDMLKCANEERYVYKMLNLNWIEKEVKFLLNKLNLSEENIFQFSLSVIKKYMICAGIYINICTRTYIYLCLIAYIYLIIYTCACLYIAMYMYICVRTHVCANVYEFICADGIFFIYSKFLKKESFIIYFCM